MNSKKDGKYKRMVGIRMTDNDLEKLGVLMGYYCIKTKSKMIRMLINLGFDSLDDN